MRFTVEQETFRRALDVADLGVGSEKGNFTTKLKFDVSEDEVSIRSTNKEVFVCVPFEPLEVQATGAFMINAERLQTWVKNVPSGPIEVRRDDGDIVASRNDIVGRFVRYRPADFPNLKVGESSVDVMTVPVDRFQKAFGFAEPFLEEVDDGTSGRAWKQVTELWDGDVVASDIKSVNCFRDASLEAPLLECDAEDMSQIERLVSQHDQVSLDDVCVRSEGDLTYVRPNHLARVMYDSDLVPYRGWSILEDFENGKLDPLRVSKRVLSGLLSFMRKVSDEEVTISRDNQRYVVRSNDGSMFGFTRSQHAMPFLIKVMHAEKEVEDHRWEMHTGELLKGIKALSATAPTNDDVLTVEFRSEDGKDVLDLKMAAEAGDSNSVYPIEVTFLEGCEGQSFRVGKERVQKVIGQYENKHAMFGLSVDEEYLRIRNEPDEDEDIDAVKFSQISLVL